MDIFNKSEKDGSWTISLEAKRWGVALLWYKPERRLSTSIWCPWNSKNIRLWGPKKLRWER